MLLTAILFDLKYVFPEFVLLFPTVNPSPLPTPNPRLSFSQTFFLLCQTSVFDFITSGMTKSPGALVVVAVETWVAAPVTTKS